MIICSFLLFILAQVFGAHEKVRLGDIQTLTLHNGQMTTGRRSSPMPQLTNVGGAAAGLFKPQVVQCYNRGFDGSDYQWECKADMDEQYRFGGVTVVCEGYDYPDDPYILKGSCGLEYNLEYSGKSGSSHQQQSSYYNDYKQPSPYSQTKSSSTFTSLVVLFIVACFIYVIYNSCVRSNNNRPHPPGFRPGGSGFDGGPPPPGSGPEYPSAPPPYSEKDTYSGASAPPYTAGFGSFFGNNQRTYPNQGANQGPGFWTGLGAGGLLGYMFGNRGNRHQNYWGGTTTQQRPTHYNQPGPSTSGWGGSGSSGGTHTSSGFGGTRRR